MTCVAWSLPYFFITVITAIIYLKQLFIAFKFYVFILLLFLIFNCNVILDFTLGNLYSCEDYIKT
jgi:hypothetical protein